MMKRHNNQQHKHGICAHPHRNEGYSVYYHHHRNIVCRNCGCAGHMYKECTQPITSYGIICYRICPYTGAREYMMIQRKDSLCFMEFIRGKYDLSNTTYIQQLFKDMTVAERHLIQTRTFQDLWNHVWYQQSVQKHTSEYNFAKTKFDALQRGVKVPGQDGTVDITHIVASTRSPSQHVEPEWGFPKGRRRIREDDVTCALREFVEETGCLASDVHLLAARKLETFEEVFFGTNHVLYKHIYYVGKMAHNGKKRIDINEKNINQVREVRAVEWFTYDDTIDHIRDHNKERKHVFKQVAAAIDRFESSRT